MILTFSQGIVTHSTITGIKGDTPNFLVIADTNTKVNLHAPLDQPFQIAFQHRDENYLVTISAESDIQAWGYGNAANYNAAFALGNGSGSNSDTFYLYVDINLSTGLTSYGWTKVAPSVGAVAPYAQTLASRPDQLHWYDNVNEAMQVWYATVAPTTYGRFSEKVRCFVAQYTFGSGFTSLSANAPSFTLNIQRTYTGYHYIGAHNYAGEVNDPRQPLFGWLDSYRVTKGTGRYDGNNYSVPTQPFSELYGG